MNSRHGKEHPYQQIKDGETAARLALEEVLKLTDEEATKPCTYDGNYCFGSWYSAFLHKRLKTVSENRAFTQEAGEAEIMDFFHPSPEEAERRRRERDELIEHARQDFMKQVEATRKETGCYREDGLFSLSHHHTEKGSLITARFVDGSRVYFSAGGEIQLTAPCGLGVVSPTMAEKWLEPVGRKMIQEIYKKRGGRVPQL